MNITSMNETITSVNGRTKPTNYQSFMFQGETVHYLPKGFGRFFPNLVRLTVYGSELKSLSQNDLKSLTQLQIIDVSMNDLEFLDDDLFEFNSKLTHVNFTSNKLKYVGENSFNNLKNLKQIDLNSNLCINNKASLSSEIPALIQKLKTQCKFPPYVFLLKEQWNEKIADLKTESQDENLKLKRWLKSCDRNLNAATGILFRTSDHQQVFTQTSSKPLDLIVVADGTKFMASELIISSPGSMISSVKHTNGSSVDYKLIALNIFHQQIELYIDHQQTLFLPTNLGLRFPALQVLAVTSSGLMQMDSIAFRSMKNLEVLNLNSNKLQEIQPGTFDQLKILESLDLSSNNLKTLETSVITGLEKLQNLNLAGNRLKEISSNILESLKVLKSVDFSNNDCINMSFTKGSSIEVKDQIIESCIAPVEIECLMRGTDCRAVNLTIVQPNAKISKLKNQIGFDSFTFSIIDQRVSFLPFQLSKTFENLRVLVVSRSQLVALHERDFEGLTRLTNITIVFNNISLIEPGVFDDVPQLEHLDLSSNNILTLPAMIFVRLTQLKTLNLSDNRLQSFLSKFLPLNNVIEEFLISYNAITKADFASSINSKKVKIIDLTHNICTDEKYDKNKAGTITLSVFLKALQNCLI